MTPYVIADSDDDEDVAYSPPPHAAVRSSDRVSNLESTDPAFFQGVLDEQSEAARQQARLRTRGGDQKAEEGPCSPMSTDPLQAGEVDYADASGLTDQASRQNGDVWDIPSSPDDYARSTSHRTRSRRPGDSPPGTGRSKRRKIYGEDNQQTHIEEVDLVQMPSTAEADGSPETSNMPPPTLPIERSSFMVAPKPLTSSQRGGYQSFAVDLDSEEPSQDQGFAETGPAEALARSSGSVTNVNTPRSETDHLDSLYATETHGEAGRWTSSADGAGRSGASSRKPRDSLRSAVSREPEGPTLQQAAFDNGGVEKSTDERLSAVVAAADHMVSAAKPKRKRGRPRKSTTSEDKDEQKPGEEDESKAASGSGASGTSTTTAMEDGGGGDDAIGDLAQKPGVGETCSPPSEGAGQQDADAGTTEVPTTKGTRTEGKGKAGSGTGVSSMLMSGGRPLYRVGLSKRSRIAPLLKTMRK